MLPHAISLVLLVLCGVFVAPAHAFLPTRLQYAQLNARLQALILPITVAEEWTQVFPIDQYFLFSDTGCGHIECHPSQPSLTLNCTAGRVPLVHLWYNMTARAFQLLGGPPSLMPNHPALVTFVDCFCSEPWALPPIDIARPQPSSSTGTDSSSNDL